MTRSRRDARQRRLAKNHLQYGFYHHMHYALNICYIIIAISSLRHYAYLAFAGSIPYLLVVYPNRRNRRCILTHQFLIVLVSFTISTKTIKASIIPNPSRLSI